MWGLSTAAVCPLLNWSVEKHLLEIKSLSEHDVAFYINIVVIPLSYTIFFIWISETAYRQKSDRYPIQASSDTGIQSFQWSPIISFHLFTSTVNVVNVFWSYTEPPRWVSLHCPWISYKSFCCPVWQVETCNPAVQETCILSASSTWSLLCSQVETTGTARQRKVPFYIKCVCGGYCHAPHHW